MHKFSDVVETIMRETQCISTTDDPAVQAVAQELAEGVTAERDAEIAAALPTPYTKRVPARAQLDGETLLIPRAVTATASRAAGGEWITSSKGPRMGREKAGCAVGVHVELDIPGVVEIVRVVILWRRER